MALTCAGLYLGYAESEDPDIPVELNGSFLCKDIYLDGQLYNNWELENPILTVDETTYIPVDKNGNINIVSKHELVYDLSDLKVTAGYHLTVDGTNANLRDVLVLENGNEYYSLDFLKKLGRADSAFSEISGLYISTDETSAESYMKENPNESFIMGRATYMMHANKSLEPEEALRLEYLFRHVATTTYNVDQNLLMGVARVESNYDAKVEGKAAGLMQVLFRFAYGAGMTHDEIMEPHNNLHYGADILSAALKIFKDETLALCSYNMGSTRVRDYITNMKNAESEEIVSEDILEAETLLEELLEAEESVETDNSLDENNDLEEILEPTEEEIESPKPLSTTYAEKVQNVKVAINFWASKNNYAKEFIEFIGK